jgi:tetratricopeptide (TPR) repeat protein
MGLWERLQKLKGKLAKAEQEVAPPFARSDAPHFVPPEPARKETGTRKRGETGARKKPETATRHRDPAAYAKRAQDRMAQGDLDGAIADFSKAIEINPDFVDAYAHRGVAKERKGDMQGAKADYSKSIEIQIRAEIKRQLDAQATSDAEEASG